MEQESSFDYCENDGYVHWFILVRHIEFVNPPEIMKWIFIMISITELSESK